MSELFKLSTLSMVFLISACATMIGVTGADTGKRVGDWVECNVNHQGLTIKIIEPHSAELLPISAVGKTSAAPLRHSVIFGTQSKQHQLDIVGRYNKEIYLDNKFYGLMWLGDSLICDGSFLIDGQLVPPVEN